MLFADIKNLIIVLALILALYKGKNSEAWLFWLRLFLIASFLTECSALLFQKFEYNNAGIYNPFILIDFTITSVILIVLNKYKKESKMLAFISAMVIAIASSVFISTKSIQMDFAIDILLISGLSLVIQSALVLYRLAERDDALFRTSVFWIATSILLFFVCFTPSFGMAMYLSNANQALANKLLDVNDILFTFRYLALIMALVLNIKKSRNVV